MRVLAFVLSAILADAGADAGAGAGADAGAGVVADHVCAPNEGKAPCTVLHVRLCATDGSLARCTCAPGQKDVKGVCTDDGSITTASCVVPDALIGRALGVQLEVSTLEMPSLTTLEQAGASTATSINAVAATDDELIRAADAWESIEGAAAYGANAGLGAKSKSKLAARDQAVNKAIEVRRAFLARFSPHLRADEQRVALARSLLRRAAYAGVAKSVEPDRKSARAMLDQVVTHGAGTRAARDAAFMVAEQAVRDRDWPLAIANEERVLKWAAVKANADDHAFLAASSARMAQARLETADMPRARAALADAVTIGLSCSPRAECVSAAGASRSVLAAVWAVTSSPGRTMAPLLRKGTMQRHERVRPLLQLADLYAKGSGTGCVAAAEEARAWEQVL